MATFKDYLDATELLFPELILHCLHEVSVSYEGSNGAKAVGLYYHSTESMSPRIVVCTDRPEKAKIHTLLHEVGHHVWHKGKGTKFEAISSLVVPEYSLKILSDRLTHTYADNKHDEEAWVQGFANLFIGNLDWYKDPDQIPHTSAILKGKVSAMKDELSMKAKLPTVMERVGVGVITYVLLWGLGLTVSKLHPTTQEAQWNPLTDASCTITRRNGVTTSICKD